MKALIEEELRDYLGITKVVGFDFLGGGQSCLVLSGNNGAYCFLSISRKI